MLRLETLSLLCIAVGASALTLGSKFPGPDSPCLPGTSCTSGKGLILSKFQQRRPALPTKYNFKKPASKDPCISKFICTFVEAVQSSQILTELFNCFSHISAEEFCYGKYPEILEALTAIGTPNAEFASQQAVEAIGDSVDVLTSEIVIEVYANSIAKYLFTQGVLNQQNSGQLALQYANAMEEAANYDDSQYAALKDGFVNFLDSLGLFTADKALLIALQYGNEWKLVAKTTKFGCRAVGK